jgi:hypothetical protein
LKEARLMLQKNGGKIVSAQKTRKRLTVAQERHYDSAGLGLHTDSLEGI